MQHNYFQMHQDQYLDHYDMDPIVYVLQINNHLLVLSLSEKNYHILVREILNDF